MNERYSMTFAAIVVCLLVPAAAHAQEMITPEQALGAAMKNNPRMRGAVDELKRADLSVVREDYRYVPTFTADGGYRFGQSPQLTSGGTRLLSSNSLTADAGLTYTLPIGTQIAVSVGAGRSVRDTAALGNLGAAYDTSADLSVTQPLLRGAGTDVIKSQYRLAKSGRAAATAQKHAAASALALDVLNAYWDLWSAQQSLDIEKHALEVNQRQLSDAQARLDVGAIAPSELAPIRIEVAKAQEQIVNAQAQVREAQIALAQLTGLKPDGLVAALSTPPPVQLPGLDNAMQTLEKNSPSLAKLHESVNAAKIQADVAHNDALPKLDATASLGVAGLGTDLGASLQSLGTLDGIVAFAGLKLELPVSNKGLKAEAERADIAVDAAKADYESELQQLSAQVATLLSRGQALDARLKLAQETAKLARQNVDAQTARFDAGKGTSLEVITAAQSLREAESAVVDIQVQLVQTQLALRDAIGTLVTA